MSKLSEYSKFDRLEEEEEDEDDSKKDPPTNFSSSSSSTSVIATPSPADKVVPSNAAAIMRRNESNGRFVFEYKGRAIYEWEQKLDDVTIYVKPPPHVTRGNQIKCIIKPQHLKLGLQGSKDWFIQEDTFGTVDVSESTWSLEDNDDDNDDNDVGGKVICIYLIKAHRGQLWDTVLKGNAQLGTGSNSSSNNIINTDLDPMAKEQVRKEMMLERFQEENPGFDFRGAEFNGSVPDARTYMGGVKYQ